MINDDDLADDGIGYVMELPLLRPLLAPGGSFHYSIRELHNTSELIKKSVLTKI